MKLENWERGFGFVLHLSICTLTHAAKYRKGHVINVVYLLNG